MCSLADFLQVDLVSYYTDLFGQKIVDLSNVIFQPPPKKLPSHLFRKWTALADSFIGHKFLQFFFLREVSVS